MPGILLCCSPCQVHRGAPLAGVLLCRLAHQALKGARWVGSYSVVQCVRHLDGPASLLFNSICWRVGRERGCVMAPPPTRDSAVSPCFHGCRLSSSGISHQSPPSHPLHPSLCRQQQPLPEDCSTVPKFQFPATVPSGVCMQWQGLSDSHSI